MKKIFLSALILFPSIFTSAQSSHKKDTTLKLWYDRPASVWTEAMPLGNGRLGAMVFGGVEDELLQLNESSLWSGGPVKTNVNPQSKLYLPLIRKALWQENYSLADSLTKKMQGVFSQSYLPMGDVMIHQDLGGAKPVGYHRDLDISKSLTHVSFSAAGVEYKREMFISAPDQVMVLRISASRKGALNLDISAKSQLQNKLIATRTGLLVLAGRAPSQLDPVYYNPGYRQPIIYGDKSGCNGMRFQFRVKVEHKDGRLVNADSALHIMNATSVIIYVTAATSFNGFDKCPVKQGQDENAITAKAMETASKKPYMELLRQHIFDYKKYFNRVSFWIKDTSNFNNRLSLPTNERLKKYSSEGSDPGLETLYFQYGRYLLISSSRPGGPPANLQGIWNKELRAPWSSNYTININTEMNYWPAEVTNLSEMHMPLLHFIKDLSKTGAATAKEFYGAHGWVAHHNSDIWALSNPVGDKGNGDPVWANWPMGGNWLARQLYEHYLYTGDRVFLAKEAYPIMKGAAEFCLDWLVEDKDGFWVTAPSTSPENTFFDNKGIAQQVSVATTMDMSIIRDLFDNVINSSEQLGIDQNFRALLTAKRDKLYPLRIGSKGQILEWYKEFKETDVHHRHVSQLFGLFPGKEITSLTPQSFTAAKTTLEIRGDEGTGWSKAWKINYWARLRDGDHAYLLLKDLLKYAEDEGINMHGGGGTYANLFDAHPPFQIDGNFGATAGMAEMLLQSHMDCLDLLPALPAAWSTGEVKGLKARGNFQIDMTWTDRKLVSAKILSINGGLCRIKTTDKIVIKGVALKMQHSNDGYISSFISKRGKIYELQINK